MRGRKPKHPHLKLIAGTARPDRVTAIATGTPVEDIPTAPDWITSARGRAEFEVLARVLHGNKALAQEVLGPLAVTAALAGKIQDTFAAGETPQGAMIAQYRGMLADLGLTGIKRVREPERENPFLRNRKRPMGEWPQR